MFEQKAKKISQRQGCKYFGFRTHPKYYSTLYTTLDDYLRQILRYIGLITHFSNGSLTGSSGWK